MKIILPLPAILLLMTSCATLFVKPTTTVDVYTPNRETAIINGVTLMADSSLMHENMSRYRRQGLENGTLKCLEVRRGDTLNVELIGQDSTIKFTVYPKVDFDSQYANIIATGGIGCIVDARSNKRFTYPVISENYYREQLQHQKHLADLFCKGSLGIHYSAAPWNTCYSNYFAGSGRTNVMGFGGLGVGLEYFYDNKRSISFDAEFSTDLPVPFVMDIWYVGVESRRWNSYFSSSLNRTGQFFTAGVGACVVGTEWYYDWHWDDSMAQEYDDNGLEYPQPTYGTETIREKHWSVGAECRLFFSCPGFHLFS